MILLPGGGLKINFYSIIRRMTFNTRQYCFDNSIISCSFNLSYDGKKKEYQNCPSWKDLSNNTFKQYHKPNHNGFMIITGIKNNIVVIDTDINKAKGNFPLEILEALDNCCESIVKTPNGRHYYFSYDKPLAKQTGAYWNNKKVEWLDILADGACIIAPNTTYTKGDEVVCYTWIKGNLSTIAPLPDTILTSIHKPEIKITNTIVSVNKTSFDNSIIPTILENLSVERWKDYSSWIKIGMIIKSYGLDVEVWDEYSKVASNYQRGACQKAWRGFPNDCSLTIATLFYYLKEDNFDVFVDLKKLAKSSIDLLTDATNNNYAKLFYNLYPEAYAFTSEAGWYELKSNNVWSNDSSKKPAQIKTKISREIGDLIDDLIDKYSNSEEAKETKDITDRLYKAKKTLQSNSFLEGILSLLQEYYYNDTLYLKLDSNKNLFAFQDKVFDLLKGEYRDILPIDYISITTGYNAPDINTPFNPELDKFFTSIFENEEKKKYLLDILSYSIGGDKSKQLIILFKGKGGNGKSLVMRLLLNCLGEYIQDIPVSYITKPDTAKDSPSPALTKAKPKRVLFTTEPESKEKLQVSFLNKITGGDLITTRTLFDKKEISYLPQFQFLLLANECKLNKVDLAIKRRLEVFFFPFQFRPKDIIGQSDNYRLINEDLQSLFDKPEIRDSFMAFLLRNYKQSKNCSSPTIVKEETEIFLDDNNPVSSFISKYYTITNNKSDLIKSSDLLSVYNQYSEEGKLRPNEFKCFMDTLGINYVSKKRVVYYVGIKKRDDIEDEDTIEDEAEEIS